jgi:ABC-type polysaccharide/polyol phosphate export permease
MKQYLQLLEVFTIREIKSRYKASLLGPLWIVLYPLMMAFLLSFIFEKIVKIKTAGIPYFVFLLSGLLFWNFFEQGVSLAKDSLVWNRGLITKSSFKKEVLPLSFILSKIPDFFVNLLILLIFMIIYKYNISLNFLILIFALIPIILFAAGIGLFFSLANAIFRDFGRIIDFLLVILFYATPILYPESFIPKRLSLFLLYFNPISLLINFSRQLLFENKIKMWLLLISFIMSLLVFILGLLFFRKFEKKIADLI